VRRASIAAAAGCSLMLSLGCAMAASLSSEGSVGVTSEYDSNPALLASGASAAESVALLATVPVTYSSDSESFDLVPSLRLAETHGDEQLLTDYQYLDGDWHLRGERNSFGAGIGWHRDSTFYNVYENAALHGRTLPRLEDTANLAWQRALSERSNLQLNASWNEVQFSSRSSFRLDNYNYVQGSLQYDRSLSERWQWTSSAGVGRYDLSGRESSNETRFLESSLSSKLSERWSATAQIGYSLLNSSSQGYLCCEIEPDSAGGFTLQYIPLKEKTSGGTVNYSLSAQRSSELLVWSLAASRSVQPSSLGALLTQDDVSLRANRTWSERLTLGATLHGSRISDTLQTAGSVTNGRYADLDLDANWLCSEHWTLAIQLSYNVERANAQTPEGSTFKVGVTLTRQFGRLRL
jgi:hypothetical protein